MVMLKASYFLVYLTMTCQLKNLRHSECQHDLPFTCPIDVHAQPEEYRPITEGLLT